MTTRVAWYLYRICVLVYRQELGVFFDTILNARGMKGEKYTYRTCRVYFSWTLLTSKIINSLEYIFLRLSFSYCNHSFVSHFDEGSAIYFYVFHMCVIVR